MVRSSARKRSSRSSHARPVTSRGGPPPFRVQGDPAAVADISTPAQTTSAREATGGVRRAPEFCPCHLACPHPHPRPPDPSSDAGSPLPLLRASINSGRGGSRTWSPPPGRRRHPGSQPERSCARNHDGLGARERSRSDRMTKKGRGRPLYDPCARRRLRFLR